MKKYSKIQRVLAMITVIVLILCILITVILAIMGSKYFWGFLFATFVLPVILWVPLRFFHYESYEEKMDEEDKRKE